MPWQGDRNLTFLILGSLESPSRRSLRDLLRMRVESAMSRKEKGETETA